jgi:3-deoxy-manno-octulosonate cytidylyltransferase (CMP-KDO synthetase)
MASLCRPIECERERNDPNVVKVVLDLDNYAIYFSRCPIPYQRIQGENAVYYKHIGVYAYARSFLIELTRWQPTPLEQTERLEQLRVLEHGGHIKMVEADWDSCGVDTPEDLARLEQQLVKEEERRQ